MVSGQSGETEDFPRLLCGGGPQAGTCACGRTEPSEESACHAVSGLER